MKDAHRRWVTALTFVVAAWLPMGPSCADRGEQRDESAGSGLADRPIPTLPAVGTQPAATGPAPTSPAETPPVAGRSALRRAHVFVSGRVQGVGFRWFTRSEALALKLTGWVKNLRDGRVEAVIEGPPEKVAELLGKIRRGPKPARVDKINVHDEPYKGQFETFDILR